MILKVDKKTPQTTRTLAEMKDEIRQMLLQQKAYQSGQAMKFQTRLMELRRDADIQIRDGPIQGAAPAAAEAVEAGPDFRAGAGPAGSLMAG